MREINISQPPRDTSEVVEWSVLLKMNKRHRCYRSLVSVRLTPSKSIRKHSNISYSETRCIFLYGIMSACSLSLCFFVFFLC